MAVRNFYIEANIDGRKEKLTGGPQTKDGGMEISLKIRNYKEIEELYTISCKTFGEILIVTINQKDKEISKEVRYR